MDEKKMKDLINAVGVIGELSLLFYRSVIIAGASQDEAYTLTRAFISASTSSQPSTKENQQGKDKM